MYIERCLEMNKIHKAANVVKREIIKNVRYLNTDFYLKLYTNYLKDIGVIFTGKNKKIKFIDPSAYFDGTDYSLISIGDNVTISREVMLLTHDYSITSAVASIGKIINRNEGELYFKREIRIGDNTFIGARASILPGTIIGNNCIIGACAVVKGVVPDNSIIIGNPYTIIGQTNMFAKKHIDKQDYFIEGAEKK
jgi:acetyltransferase-like isoleucine patch superfamily enzyme